jgi:hypothetical protein
LEIDFIFLFIIKIKRDQINIIHSNKGDAINGNKAELHTYINIHMDYIHNKGERLRECAAVYDGNRRINSTFYV